MITYVNSGNDAKRFNTFALAAKHSLIKKQQSINTQIDYLKNVYNSYVSHYNQLQKLIKEINDLTGESKYTKVDYSNFPAVDITASFSMKTKNVRLVPEGTSSLRFKNTIEDLRNNFSDLSLSIKSFYSRIAAEISPYSSMKRRADSIRERSSSATNVVGTNINTALAEGDLSTEDWSTIKEHASSTKDETDKTLSSESEGEAAKKVKETAKEVGETAWKAIEQAFDNAAKDAQDKANEAQDYANKTDKVLNDFGGGFWSSKYVNQGSSLTSYEDPITKETFETYSTIDEHRDLYVDGNGVATTLERDPDTGQYIVKKNGEEVGTYDREIDAITAADDAAGKHVFSRGILLSAQDTYEESKQKAKENNDEAQEAAKEAAEKAAEAEKVASGLSEDSSGGT